MRSDDERLGSMPVGIMGELEIDDDPVRSLGSWDSSS